MNVRLWLKLEVFVKFDKSDNDCGEFLNFDVSCVPAKSEEYCAKWHKKFLRNYSDYHEIPQHSSKILQFRYSKTDPKEGGKFVLQADGKCV